jgi:NADH-quinone oxidoreductase subunit C
MTTEQAPAKAPEGPPPVGPYGQFLKEHGIESKRLPDSRGVGGQIENIEVDRKDLEAAVRFLRNDSEVGLDLLLTVSGVETNETFDSVYHLWSYTSKNELVIKAVVAKTECADEKLPMVPSLAKFWKTANWHERETYDLMGIRYLGHPYLRRILNPWDWEGYPLRRDYKQPIDALNDKNPHSFR